MMMNLHFFQKAPPPQPTLDHTDFPTPDTLNGLTPTASPISRPVKHCGKMNFQDEKNKDITFVEPKDVSGSFASTRLKFDSLTSEAFTNKADLMSQLYQIYKDFELYLNCETIPIAVWNQFKSELHATMQQFITDNINALLDTEGLNVRSFKSVVPPTFREAGSKKSGVSPIAHIDNALLFQPLIRLNSHGRKYNPAHNDQCLELNFWFPLGRYSKNLLAVKDMSNFKSNEMQARKFTKITNTTNMLGRIKWLVNPLRVAKTTTLERGDFVCPTQSRLYDFVMFDTSQSLHGPIKDPSTYDPAYDEGDRRSMELRYAIQLDQPLKKEVL